MLPSTIHGSSFLSDESTSLPPSPLLLLYSDQGVLCPYTVINTGRPPSELKDFVIPPHPLPSGPVRQPTISTRDQNRPPQQSQASSQPLLGTLSQGFTPAPYTQPGSSSVPGSSSAPGSSNLPPPYSSGPQLTITTATTSRLGPSPLTMGGMTLGGNKLGSATTTQPSFSQFSVSALTGGQPFRPPPPSYSRPQLQASSGVTASSGFFLRPGAPAQRPSGTGPLLATAGSLTDSLSVTRGVQQPGQLPPPYVAPTTSILQLQSVVPTPASQPPPNVSLPPMTMQPPRATRPLDQSFQLAGMPPLFSSTPVAPMSTRPPAAQGSGVPWHMAAARANIGLQSQQQSQPGIPPPSMVAPPMRPQPGVPPPSVLSPPTRPQPGLPPPSMVSPPTRPQPGLPPPSMVSPPTRPQPGAAQDDTEVHTGIWNEYVDEESSAPTSFIHATDNLMCVCAFLCYSMGIILRRLRPPSPRAFKMRSVRLDSVEYPIASFPGHVMGVRLYLVGVNF